MDDESAVAVRALVRARRRNRAAEVDVFDSFYKAYALGIACAAIVLLLSDAIGDQRVTPHQLTQVKGHGPELIGVGVAAVLAIALRSGARGGPLVLPAADVRHVLLAPVPRSVALRPAAVRQIRFSSFVGLVVGGGLGVLASHRLPGGTPGWVVVGGAIGGIVGATTAGLGLVACGRRLRPWMGVLFAAALLGWSGIDVWLHRVTSPMALVGQLALIPVRFHPVALAVVAVSAAVVVAGVAGIGGMSLEHAERRATLASQIRFALTLQDLRTVMLLRRQLTQEQPRPRPWVRLRALSGSARVIWRRDVRGLARWPAVRIIRIVALGAIAGLALVGTWTGTTPLIVVAALALFLAGLEAVEPLAQEVDHPDLPASTPTVVGSLRIGHAIVPLGVMLVVCLIGWAAAMIVAAAGAISVHLALTVGPALVVPAALLGTIGAAVSVVMEPKPMGGGDLMPIEFAGMKMIARAVWSPLLVFVGLTPLLIARDAARRGVAPGPAAVSGAILPVMVGVLGLGWLRFREQIHASMEPPA